MENAKPTPGPWIISDSGQTIIAQSATTAEWGVVASLTRDFSAHWEANARLLATAPELLEALRASAQALSVLSGKATEATRAMITATAVQAGLPLGRAELEKARAAIAKATQD